MKEERSMATSPAFCSERTSGWPNGRRNLPGIRRRRAVARLVLPAKPAKVREGCGRFRSWGGMKVLHACRSTDWRSRRSSSNCNRVGSGMRLHLDGVRWCHVPAEWHLPDYHGNVAVDPVVAAFDVNYPTPVAESHPRHNAPSARPPAASD